MSRAEQVAPLADIVAEAGRVLDVAQSNGVPIRLIGGLAVYFHTEEIPQSLRRSYADIDIATEKGAGRRVSEFISDLGYEPSKEFNALLALEERTIPLAELLLTKLQVIEMTEKDLRDIVTLLDRHEVGEHDGDAVNADFVAKLTADDWGLWRTVKLNLERLHEQIGSLPVEAGTSARVLERADVLWERIEQEPKSKKWRLRDRVGDRKRRYELPDEV